MSDNPRVAILSFSRISRDARVLRQIDCLSKHYSVMAIGYGQLETPPSNDVGMVSIHPPAKLLRRARKLTLLPVGRALSPEIYEAWYWSEPEFVEAFNALLESGADAIHANDWESLPVAIKAAQKLNAEVIVDLHEYAPLMRTDRTYWRWFYKPMIEYFLRTYLPYASGSITVGPGVARRYEEEYGLKPRVIRNIPHSTDPPGFRATEPDEISLIHHGSAIRDRQLELMIEALAHTDPRYVLHLMLLPRHRGYIAALKQLAESRAPNRVHFHPPVPPTEISRRISAFDVGIFVLPPVDFNSKWALPNKFFEFVAAGLAVCIGPSPEMARLTKRFGFGLVAPSFEPRAVAHLLNDVSAADIDEMKRKSIRVRQCLNSDAELGKLVDLYKRLL